ncbi:hypothetical protein BKA56DRAFT_603483 [Ilyonectria sp. MPI-CAGE-AT-0026]|nr:hypothetical protein BKA56DRAFT_603483 [Ilyonectria sp. MPI-CAGE-AT-0026]
MADCPMFRAPTTGSAAELTDNIHDMPESRFGAVIASTFKKTDEQTRQTITVEVTNIVELPLLSFEVGDCEEAANYDPKSPDANVKLWTDSKGEVRVIELPNHALIDPLKTFHEMGRSVDANYPAFDLASMGEGPLKVVAELLASTEILYKEILGYLKRFALLAGKFAVFRTSIMLTTKVMKTGTAERTDPGRENDAIVDEPGHRLDGKAVISRLVHRQADVLLSLHLIVAQRKLEVSFLELLAVPKQENWEACLLVVLALCQLHEIYHLDCKRRAQENADPKLECLPWLLEAVDGVFKLSLKLEDARTKLPQPDKAVQLCLPSIQRLCTPKTSTPVKFSYDWFLVQGVAQGK